ncbi:MAG TPA: hypothetical protein DEO98_05785, partial [Legionellales bacterium]|nr:hypothetical protein [Legionellales bacterium]
KLEGYIEKIKPKLKTPTAQTDSVMRGFMCKIKNDADITNSTSRFFKLNSRVTVINDLERLNNTLNHV